MGSAQDPLTVGKRDNKHKLNLHLLPIKKIRYNVVCGDSVSRSRLTEIKLAHLLPEMSVHYVLRSG